MNRNDLQSGWDTDQFPNSAADCMLAYYEILKMGGFTTGGTNFDAKVRRQSLDPEDLILAHVGGMDTCARGLKAAARMLADGKLEGDACRALREMGHAGQQGDAAPVDARRHRRAGRLARGRAEAAIGAAGAAGEPGELVPLNGGLRRDRAGG